MSIMSIYAVCGRISYRLIKPFAKLWLRKSRRGYLLLCYGNEVLVIKNWFGEQYWHLPGGGSRRGESLAETACRETSEELGYSPDASTLKMVASGAWGSEDLNFTYEIFAVNLEQKPRLRLKRPEILKAAWHKPQELNATNTPKEILAAIRASTGAF